jgi:hypothetical protein
MRKYIDYNNEITKEDLYNGLVGYGLFAEKIPNFLTSVGFLEFTKTLNFPISEKQKDYIRYSSMRNINIPRPIAIPEPFAYTNQVKCIVDNWDNLKLHFKNKTINDTFKISRIHLRKLKNSSALFEMNYKNFFKDGDPEQEIKIKSKYIAMADISNCFPTIYSHSIPWALVGKTEAKLKIKDKNKWFNQLDFFTRNLKYGETNGVLIGPHSSNLISEIILVSVDFELSKQSFNFVRNIDDYTCYVDSYDEANLFFLSLSEELKKFELSINNKKSKIIPLPLASVKNWVTRLNHFNFINTYQVDGKQAIRIKELKGFMNFSIELMLNEDSDASILNYAIKIISNKYLGKNAKEYYIKQIHHLVLLYPYLIGVLEKDVFEPHKIEKKLVQSIATDIFEYGIETKSYEACSYALYWAIKYDFQLEIENIKEKSINSLDCIFLMISYLYDKKHNKASYLTEYKILAESLKKVDFDKYWLFIYETLSIDKLTDKYKLMKKQKISFIKPEFLI